jgi:ABC-type multidrug transport system fused ATPase/permease subunit
MSTPIAIALYLGILAFSALTFFDPGTKGIYELYQSKLQTPLFTGFLTIGGFLLTLKTFVLIRLKEEVYQSPFYRTKLEERRHLNPDLTLYAPLGRLTTLLVFSVLAALLTAVSQMSVGFIPGRLSAAFCISMAVTALALVFQSWFHIRENLNRWFELLEEEENEKRNSETSINLSGNY